jgi:predicted RNA binding protein YcfA (HicA-like mRNA interferase family)
MQSHNRRDVVRLLHFLGFRCAGSSGPHDVFRHPDGRLTSVPRHATIPAGTCRTIARHIQMLPQRFDRLVRR